ncbi:unnamed protein product [Prorocentrum cordatum]|uniref:Uncharacterized protein n=1 Tax=Prorocentrum cordatum TaxID=2364126 RepID=A0ABN9XX04_9DINO|nr:unnamed protein product [Polarella glacialis]
MDASDQCAALRQACSELNEGITELRHDLDAATPPMVSESSPDCAAQADAGSGNVGQLSNAAAEGALAPGSQPPAQCGTRAAARGVRALAWQQQQPLQRVAPAASTGAAGLVLGVSMPATAQQRPAHWGVTTRRFIHRRYPRGTGSAAPRRGPCPRARWSCTAGSRTARRRGASTPAGRRALPRQRPSLPGQGSSTQTTRP